MKVRIETDASLSENEIVIRCRETDEEALRLKNALIEAQRRVNLIFYRDNKEFYLPLEDILFFEASGREADAHTAAQVYRTGKKLRELSEILPYYFIRASKSVIVNTKRIYSIERNITSASLVQFENSHKQIYVSRGYYKAFKERLEEIRGE